MRKINAQTVGRFLATKQFVHSMPVQPMHQSRSLLCHQGPAMPTIASRRTPVLRRPQPPNTTHIRKNPPEKVTAARLSDEK
jgi:hypothetical protein